MGKISIRNTNVEETVLEIVDMIQTDIIDASTASRDTIINTVENSSGDFIESLKEEIAQEAVVINAVGDLLIELAKYIQSAAEAFASVDTSYKSSKVARINKH